MPTVDMRHARQQEQTTMGYKGIVKGNVVVLEEGVRLPDGLQVDIIPVDAPRQGSPAALLEVWGSEVPDAVWDTVEKALEHLDRLDKERLREHPHA